MARSIRSLRPGHLFSHSAPAPLQAVMSELGLESADLASFFLDLGVGGVLADAADGPAHGFRTAGCHARGDQGIYRRQIGGSQIGPHGSEPRCLIRYVRAHAEEKAREAPQN